MSSQLEIDRQWMAHALRLAVCAEQADEVPVGAVLVRGGELLAEGWNRPISLNDPTAHAEVMALRAAGEVLDNYRLCDTTLYVTLEPCVMCLGAIVHARVERLVFGAHDPRAGAVESAFELLQSGKFNHEVVCEGGVMAEACGEMLRAFFRRRR